MFCSNCGNKLKEGEKFCSDCGKPINSVEKANKSSYFNKKIILIIVGIIALISIIVIVIYASTKGNSNKENSNIEQTTNNIQQDNNLQQDNNIEANKNQIKQNTKYVVTGSAADLYKQEGLNELYLVFNNGEFKLVCNMNMGGDEYETYIKGTYNQTENNIIFDFSNAKAGYNNGEPDETGNMKSVIDSWAELFKEGATVSNENKTLTVTEMGGITLAFEDSGIQVAKEENTTSSNNVTGPKLSFTLAANIYNGYLEDCRFSHWYSRKDRMLKCERLALYGDVGYAGNPDIHNTIYCKDDEYTDMYKVEFKFYFDQKNINKLTDEYWNDLQELYVYDTILRAVLGNTTKFDGLYPLEDRSIDRGGLEKIKNLVNASGDNLYNKLINNQINGLKYTYKEVGNSRYIIIEETE